MLAHRARSGERDFTDHRMRNEVFGNLRGDAVDQIDHARGQPGVDEGAHQLGDRAGRVLRPLDHDRAAGRYRAGNLAHRLIDREIPRRERRDRTDRLLDGELIEALRPRRYHPPVGAPALFGEPVDEVGAGEGLHLGFADRLALLHRHQPRDLVGAAAQVLRRLAHQLVALERRDLAPRLKALPGRPRRALEIGGFRVRDVADRFPGRGIEHRDGLAAGPFGPAAVDVKGNIRIHRFLLQRFKASVPSVRPSCRGADLPAPVVPDRAAAW